MPKTIAANFKDLIAILKRNDPSATDLELEGAQLNTADHDDIELRDALHKNDTLKKLSLRHCELNDAMIEEIAKGFHAPLEFLDLSHNSLSFLGAEALAGVGNLKILNLSHNQIENKGILRFGRKANLGNFTSLDFATTSLDDSAGGSLLKITQNNPSLSDINLAGNELSEDVLTSITEILKTRKSGLSAASASALARELKQARVS